MKAWLLDDFTGLGALRLSEVPDPVPAPGEAVLKLHLAALNPADRYLAERQYPLKPALPHILGRDGIGEVIKVAPGVSGIREGDVRAILRGDVGGTRPGTFAEQVAIPAEDLIAIPSGWSEAEAAGATLVYLTAYQALTMWGPLPKGAVVLVTGATGGVGVAAIQLAKAMGYSAIGLSRNETKSKRLEEIGADYTFNHTVSEWRRNLKAALSPRRVDLAIDNIGGPLLPEVIDTLGDQGRVSVVGRLGGLVPNFNTATLFFRRLRIGGVAVGAYAKPEGHAAWREVVNLLTVTSQRPLVDSIFDFHALPQAFEQLQRGPMGKVLIRCAGI